MLKAALLFCLSLTAIDGDTVDCDGTRLRLLGNGTPFVDGVDAPEMGTRAKCSYERALAEASLDKLDHLLMDSDIAIEDSGEEDVFGRKLVRIRLSNGETAGQTLIEKGLADVWRRGQKIDWCKGH